MDPDQPGQKQDWDAILENLGRLVKLQIHEIVNVIIGLFRWFAGSRVLDNVQGSDIKNLAFALHLDQVAILTDGMNGRQGIA